MEKEASLRYADDMILSIQSQRGADSERVFDSFSRAPQAQGEGGSISLLEYYPGEEVLF